MPNLKEKVCAVAWNIWTRHNWLLWHNASSSADEVVEAELSILSELKTVCARDMVEHICRHGSISTWVALEYDKLKCNVDAHIHN